MTEVGYEIGLSDEMFEINEDGKVEVRSIVEFMWLEVGTELGPCDGMSNGRDVGKQEDAGER